MEYPKVPKSFITAIQIVRSGLNVIFIRVLERYAIIHQHEHTKQFRVVKVIENDDGSFRMPDTRDIVYVQKNVHWELIDRFPSIKDLGDFYLNEKKIIKQKKIKNRQEWIKDFIKDNRKRVKEAVRDLWENKGRNYRPQAPGKKIIMDYGAPGYKTQNGLLVPTFTKG